MSSINQYHPFREHIYTHAAPETAAAEGNSNPDNRGYKPLTPEDKESFFSQVKSYTRLVLFSALAGIGLYFFMELRASFAGSDEVVNDYQSSFEPGADGFQQEQPGFNSTQARTLRSAFCRGKAGPRFCRQ